MSPESDIAARRRPLGPWRFLAMASILYLLGLATHVFIAPAALPFFGLLPFLFLQILLTLAWYALHTTRLHNTDRAISPVQGITAIYVLAAVLLVLIGIFYVDNLSDGRWMPQSFVLVRQLVTFNRGTGDVLTYLGLIACLALLIPPVFSVWAAALPGKHA